MSFTATLTNAVGGMNASSLRAEILSLNIANAQTEHYARRSVSFATARAGGVKALSVERAEAGRTELQLHSANANLSSAEARANGLNAIDLSFGEPGDADGLYAVYARFEEALSDLRLTPEGGAAQQATLRAAKDVAETFNRLGAEAQAMRQNADRTIAQSTERLNGTLSELRELNEELRRPRTVSVETVGERQRALVQELSRDLGIQMTGRYGEPLSIRTREGYPLLGQEAAVLDFTPTGSIGYSTSFGGGGLSGLTIDGRDATPGTLQGIAEGDLAAQFAMRDVLATDYADRLNAAAEELVARLEAADATGPGGLFVLTPGVGSAADLLAVNDAVDPSVGGELFRLRDGVGAAVSGPEAGDGVLGAVEAALLELRPLTVATGNVADYSYIDMLGAMGTVFGTAAFRAEGILTSAQNQQFSLGEEHARLTGVDTDRELQDLILVEQAFSANARVIQAADEMLRQLMEI